MPRVRISTTVDDQLLAAARALHLESSDAGVIDRALRALVAEHRRAEIDAAYDEAYRRHSLDEPDAWGDLRSFGDAVRSR